MKIAVNTRLLIKNKLEGIGWFTYETLKRIVVSHPEHEFYFIFDRNHDKEFIFSDNVIPIVIGPPARHPILFYYWFEFAIPKILKKTNADLFISPDAYLSLKTNVKSLLIIHDLNFEHFPKLVPWAARKHYQYFTPRFAQKATRIATVSAFSKNDIINQYQIDENKIDVVYNGANELFHPLSRQEKEETKKEYTGGKEYFLFIGALNPRKNLVNLFKAFDIFKKSDQSDTKLLIVGEKMWWNREIKTTFEQMKFQGNVIFTGRIEPTELNRMMGSAIALTYVSIFEGFGIPIVEAFYSGTPVITSNVTSMPEIAGDAALLIDPYNPQSIANAMEKLNNDKVFCENLIKKGIQRSKLFSWNKTAEDLWHSIERVMNDK